MCGVQCVLYIVHLTYAIVPTIATVKNDHALQPHFYVAHCTLDFYYEVPSNSSIVLYWRLLDLVEIRPPGGATRPDDVPRTRDGTVWRRDSSARVASAERVQRMAFQVSTHLVSGTHLVSLVQRWIESPSLSQIFHIYYSHGFYLCLLLQQICHILTLWTPEAGILTLHKLPYGARSWNTGGTVYQRHCQKPVYRRHGISTPQARSRYTGFVF